MNEEKVENYLYDLDLNPSDRGRYWLIRCPRHEDRTPSAQCFKNDGFIECHAGCGRFHINEVAKERGDPLPMPSKYSHNSNVEASNSRPEPKHDDKPVIGDFTSIWVDLAPLDNDFILKGVAGLELNKRGWRKYNGETGLPPGIFIPYFNTNRDRVVFYQVRHLEGERRFSFAPGITPVCYGQEMLPHCKQYLLITEGSRDSVILGMVGVPAIALPSASSDKLLEKICSYCTKMGIMLVWAGDRDEAGDALLKKLSYPALDYRTPVGKDVGEFFEQKGLQAVADYYAMFKTLS